MGDEVWCDYDEELYDDCGQMTDEEEQYEEDCVERARDMREALK